MDQRVEVAAGLRITPGAPARFGIPLPSGYELRARITVDAPASGSTDCAVELRFDTADPHTGYALRLRELTGVRYVSLLRRERGDTETLVDVVFGYSFDTPVDVAVTIDGPRIEASLDGVPVAAVNDVHRLRYDAVGFAADRTGAEVASLTVRRLHDEPLPTVTPATPPSPGETTLDGVPAELGDWYLLSGRYGSRTDLHRSLDGQRLRFTRTEVRDEHTTVLHADDVPGYDDVSVTWSVAQGSPRATIGYTPTSDGYHVAVCHGFAPQRPDDVTEVLCGPLRHARIVGGPESVGASELTAPFCLVETATGTVGLYVPAEDLSLADEVTKDPDDQPYGMSLTDPSGVRPIAVLPQYGRRAHHRAGEPVRHTIGYYAAPVRLSDAYRELARTEYHYRAYRRNAFGSLTDTVHNLVDLLASGPDTDDSAEYQASPSGWWGRAKGFIDIENDQAVRATTTAVLLSAAYLTGDLDFYHRRARPVVEYQVSRNGYGWTPKLGYDVYADTTKHQLCATPLGVTALGALHQATRRQNPGIARLASDAGADQDYWLRRAPMCAPLAAYRMDRDPAQLAEARRLADDYIAERIDRPATEPLDAHDFAIYYCADWVGLLELYEETREPRYLDAALAEARRFATQVFVRPVHDGTVTVPDRPQFRDRQIELSRWWHPEALYQYPRGDIPPEPVPAWLLSITGLSFEAVKTYRYSGPNQNPTWASALLRLAYHAGDDLLRDVAHNAAVGRFTNYPGYYFRQHSVHQMKPDFPYQGPFDNTTIYYHHAPAQLGMAIDYLVTEHETRSGGEIRFPAAFEENFVWFRFRTYGYQPGSFYGDDDVWPWLPRDLVSLDTHAVNWLAGRNTAGDRFYLSLTNSSAEPQRVTARVPVSGTATVYTDGKPGEATIRDGQVTVEVSGHGITALVVPEVALPDAPLLWDPAPVTDTGDSYHFDDHTPVGAVRGLLLAHPDGAGADGYVQSRCATPAVLRYSLDGGATWHDVDKPVHPAEWTVRLTGDTFLYRVRDAHGALTEPVTLRVPAVPAPTGSEAPGC